MGGISYDVIDTKMVDARKEYLRKHILKYTDRKKTRKHVAERNRRARINYYLEEIEKLISPSIIQPSSPAKLEKAEVLERAVNYLKQHKASQMNVHQNYIRGFLECIRSIQALMLTMKVSENDVRHIFHGCLASVKNRLQIGTGQFSESTERNSESHDNIAGRRIRLIRHGISKSPSKGYNIVRSRRAPLGELSTNSLENIAQSPEECVSDYEMSDDENHAVDLTLTNKLSFNKSSNIDEHSSDSQESHVTQNKCDDDSMWRPW